jgi:outer membrane protein TolC
VKYLKNQTLPSLDFSANYTTQGVGGTRYVRSGLGGVATDVIPGGYRDALGTLGSFDYPQWGFQFNLSYPIGGSAQNAQYARSQVQRNQVEAQLEALELQVATDVTSAALSVQTSLTAYEAAVAARELREAQLEAEQSRFEVGLSTSYVVVQAQRDLSTSQDSELRALLNYRQALVEFERVQVTSAGVGGITSIN